MSSPGWVLAPAAMIALLLLARLVLALADWVLRLYFGVRLAYLQNSVRRSKRRLIETLAGRVVR